MLDVTNDIDDIYEEDTNTVFENMWQADKFLLPLTIHTLLKYFLAHSIYYK